MSTEALAGVFLYLLLGILLAKTGFTATLRPLVRHRDAERLGAASALSRGLRPGQRALVGRIRERELRHSNYLGSL